MVYSTCGSDEEAYRISDGLVDRRLAACVNIAEINSIFHWQGGIDRQEEWLLIAKSIRSRFPEIERFIRANHSYECPEIIAVKLEAASEDYAAWVRAECSNEIMEE